MGRQGDRAHGGECIGNRVRFSYSPSPPVTASDQTRSTKFTVYVTVPAWGVPQTPKPVISQAYSIYLLTRR